MQKNHPPDAYFMNDPSAPVPTTRAIIDLAAFRHNVGVIRSYIAPRVKVMAVVKAHAYGHGLRVMSREAVLNGVEWLGVARAEEGFELRESGISSPILIFEVAPEQHFEAAIMQDIELTVSSVQGAERLNSVAQKLGRNARVHVKVDTGMTRLGFDYHCSAESIESIGRLKHLTLSGVYSHFATAEDSDQAFAKTQLSRFTSVLDELERRKIEIPLRHMANSGAIISLPESHFDIVRPGIMLFGLTPRQAMHTQRPLKPVMSLHSRISLIRTVESGVSVSYGRKYYTTAKTDIATVPLGYGDGYSRLLTNKAEVLIRGKRYPSVGAICMDHLMVNLGTGHDVSVGDEVTLVGRDGNEEISCWDLAVKIGTIPYEVTCLITPRVTRLYSKNSVSGGMRGSESGNIIPRKEIGA